MNKLFILLILLLLLINPVNAEMTLVDSVVIDEYDFFDNPWEFVEFYVHANNSLFIILNGYDDIPPYEDYSIIVKYDNNLNLIDNISLEGYIFQPALMTDGEYLYLQGYPEYDNYTYSKTLKLDSNLNIILSNNSQTFTNIPTAESWFYHDNYIYFQSNQIDYYYAYIRKLNTSTLEFELSQTVTTATNYFSQPLGAEYFNDGFNDYGYFWVGQRTGGINKILLSNLSIIANYLNPPFTYSGNQWLSGYRGEIIDNYLYMSNSYNTHKIKKINLSDFSDSSYIDLLYYFFTDSNKEFLYTYISVSVDYYINKTYLNGSLIESINLSTNNLFYPLTYNAEFFNGNYLYVLFTDYGGLNKIYKIQLEDVTTFTLSGNIKLLDTDNSSNNLENVYVKINNTLNDFTDSNGNYEITDIPFGTYSLTINYSLGTEILTDSITSLSGDLSEDYIIRYSKPFLTNPEISGSYLTTIYSHNYKSLNLWENPNYVWGNYTYNNNSYIQSCDYISGNNFRCDSISDKTYTFKFIYSDMYNHDLNSYHPTLTGQRQFTTDLIYFIDGAIVDNETGETEPTLTPIRISDSNPIDKENRTYVNFMDALFIMCIIIFIIIVISFGDKTR